MANIAEPCSCIPYVNICSCEPQSGISVVQPACQTLPDGSIVNNPAFVPSLNKSFWSYKFITDSSSSTRAISNFGIPICENIPQENIVVREKIDGCGTYVSVPFELITNDPNLGLAPEGYQYLKVETDERYDVGVCVEYMVEIIGDFPLGLEAIKVKAENNVFTFGCFGCFIVPMCNPQGTLVVTKMSNISIFDNQAVLNYTIHVDNIGNAPVDNVQFVDTLFVPTQLSLGQIIVSPETLNIDTSIPGEVITSGNLGLIEPGGKITITYQIPIAGVTAPGLYIINNTATASATGTSDSASNIANLRVVKLRADKCCSIDNNTGIYTLTISSIGDSPDILVDLFDNMIVPAGVTVKFLELSGCEGFFTGTQNPIPTNTNITGPADFTLICKNALVPSGGSYVKIGRYELVSSSVVGTSTIQNTITDIIPVNPEGQILLSTENLPVSANIEVQLTQICINPC